MNFKKNKAFNFQYEFACPLGYCCQLFQGNLGDSLKWYVFTKSKLITHQSCSQRIKTKVLENCRG